MQTILVSQTGVQLQFNPHFAHQHFHVVPDVDFGAGGAEEVGGVIGDDDTAVTVGVENSAQTTDGLRGLEECFRGNGTQANDEFRLDDLQLPVREVPAVFDFDIAWIAVSGWPAFDCVQNVDFFPLELAGLDDLVE